ncbi:hypothetical protein ANDO1_3826 [plant metagenome]|uniref:Uncharacterized protein n=1 Tax=plant metagenome TaxID=1297885 RepID=A0A484PTE3_9ZZZZ
MTKEIGVLGLAFHRGFHLAAWQHAHQASHTRPAQTCLT